MLATPHWRLPDPPLRASAVAAALLGLVTVVVIAEIARGFFPLGGLYGVKAGAMFAIVMLLSFGFLQRNHPFSRFGAANQVTTIRTMLVALIAALFGEPRFPIVAAGAAMMSLVAIVLDGVDGWLARRQRLASDFGARFDMEIDALLILVLSVLVSRFQKAGAWVIASGLMRYIFVGAGLYWTWLQAPLTPSRRRQAICVFQILALTLAVVPGVQPPLSTMLAAAALASLAYSFLVDTLWLWRRAQ
jgi:phosphatidylglycerophosphate synthase